MTSQDSLLARSLEPLAASLWTLFVIVSVLVGGVWAFAIGDGMVERCVAHPDLRAALEWMLAQADLAWITLAAMNVYLVLAAHEGLATARRWALLIFAVVVALGWLSTRTGFPLGPIQYGTPLGAKLGPVPLGLPLLWVAVILAVRETVLLGRPRASHGQVALLTGLGAGLMDLLLETPAAQLRGFWFWRASAAGDPPVFEPPASESLAWGACAALLAFGLREKEVAASMRQSSWKAPATLAIFSVVFAAAHLGRWLRG